MANRKTAAVVLVSRPLFSRLAEINHQLPVFGFQVTNFCSVPIFALFLNPQKSQNIPYLRRTLNGTRYLVTPREQQGKAYNPALQYNPFRREVSRETRCIPWTVSWDFTLLMGPHGKSSGN